MNVFVDPKTVMSAEVAHRRFLDKPHTYCRRAQPAAGIQDGSDLQRGRILLGDALRVLTTLPTGSVDCVITSPPYFLLRNYQIEGQLGHEPSIHGWVDNLVAVCEELGRVLKPTGSLWLNLGDSYSRHPRQGAAPKGLLLGPERLLVALAERGWIVRNKIVWAKPNAMPASVRDRLSCSWEPLYLLVRSRDYFFDLDAIREPHTSRSRPATRTMPTKYGKGRPEWAGPLAGANDGLLRARSQGRVGHPKGRNPRDVWTMATSGYRGAHFATFPTRLVERPLLAGCPARVCVACGQPWRNRDQEFAAVCQCRSGWRPGLVLDPFMGAGTVAVTAEAHSRDWLGIELNPAYRELALQRLAAANTNRTQKEVMHNHKKGGTA